MGKVLCSQINLSEAHIGRTVYGKHFFVGKGQREPTYYRYGKIISFNKQGQIFVGGFDFTNRKEQVDADNLYLETEEAKSARNHTA